MQIFIHSPFHYNLGSIFLDTKFIKIIFSELTEERINMKKKNSRY